MKDLKMGKDEFTTHLKACGYNCEMHKGLPTVFSKDQSIRGSIINEAKKVGYNSSFALIFHELQ